MIHREIRALLHYWEGLRAGRPCPFRAEIDPRAMHCNVRHLFIFEDLGHGNIRFRLAGTALTDAFGMELRGMSARAVMEMSARESFAELIAETLAEPGICYLRLKGAHPGQGMWEMILLPLRSDFGRIDRIIGALHPLDATTAPAEVPLRFTIEHMEITPVEVTVADEPQPISGFAEVQKPFEHLPAENRPVVAPLPAASGSKPRGLTAIDGGKGRAANTDGGPGDDLPPGGRRPRLRVVK
ncbi:MAG: PAS domain-containing protein [Pseudomonadota bacterium]